MKENASILFFKYVRKYLYVWVQREEFKQIFNIFQVINEFFFFLSDVYAKSSLK